MTERIASELYRLLAYLLVKVDVAMVDGQIRILCAPREAEDLCQAIQRLTKGSPEIWGPWAGSQEQPAAREPLTISQLREAVSQIHKAVEELERELHCPRATDREELESALAELETCLRIAREGL